MQVPPRRVFREMKIKRGSSGAGEQADDFRMIVVLVTRGLDVPGMLHGHLRRWHWRMPGLKDDGRTESGNESYPGTHQYPES